MWPGVDGRPCRWAEAGQIKPAVGARRWPAVQILSSATTIGFAGGEKAFTPTGESGNRFVAQPSCAYLSWQMIPLSEHYTGMNGMV
jgi:hypothetical protein